MKDEADRKMVKKLLKQDFKLLRDAYKLTAGEDSSGTSMSIGKNAFMLLLQRCGDLVDQKTLNTADLGIAYIASKAADMSMKSKLVPMKELIRHNFLEVHIRLAQQKYIKSGLFKTYHEALKSMMTTYIVPQYQAYDVHIWRKKSLWKEENDLAIKR